MIYDVRQIDDLHLRLARSAMRTMCCGSRRSTARHQRVHAARSTSTPTPIERREGAGLLRQSHDLDRVRRSRTTR